MSIYEDVLYKYKPGLKIDNFVQKYIKVTNRNIYIYKDEYTCNFMWESKPQYVIPLDLIKDAKKVKMILLNRGNNGRPADWENYQFKFIINLDLTQFGIETQPLEPLRQKMVTKKSKPQISRNEYDTNGLCSKRKADSGTSTQRYGI